MTNLHAAIRKGDAVKASDLIFGKSRFWLPLNYIRGTELVNSKNWSGDTPLHLAITKYSENPSIFKVIIDALLAAKADKEITNVMGYNPLHLAVMMGLVDVVRLLLEKGATIDAPVINKNLDSDAIQTTALGLAAMRGHDEVIEELFKYKPRIDGLSGSNSITPLQAAAASGRLTTVQLILNKGANINYTNNLGEFLCRNPLWYALDYGFKNGNNFEVAKFLLMNGADPNARRFLYGCSVMALNEKMRAKADELLSSIMIINMKQQEKIESIITANKTLYIQYENIKICVSNPCGLFIQSQSSASMIRYTPARDFKDLLPNENISRMRLAHS